MLVLEKSRIYQGTLILVNRAYPVRCQQPKQELCSPFPEQAQIMMEQESARMLKKLLREVLTNDLVLSGKQGVLLQHGNAIVGVSGYRSREEQVEIFENSLLENGRDFTEKYVAFPDHSEHQIGLAIDLAENQPQIDFICPEFPYQGICQEFREKMAEFGFVERYPKAKQKITGIGAEPWHFRYVGAPHAALMAELGMVLEEYIEWLKQFDLKKHPCILHRRREEVAIGYVKAKGDYTRIEGLEALAGRIRKAWQMRNEAKNRTERFRIKISGNNVDGFICTCRMGTQA